MRLFSSTFSNLEKALNYSALKQKVISQNVANVDTPNYKAKDVSFKSLFQEKVNDSIRAHRTDTRHFDFSVPNSGNAIYTRNNGRYNQNGNSVDIDKEMADLAKNQIYYTAVAEKTKDKFSSLQNVIRGGK